MAGCLREAQKGVVAALELGQEWAQKDVLIGTTRTLSGLNCAHTNELELQDQKSKPDKTKLDVHAQVKQRSGYHALRKIGARERHNVPARGRARKHPHTHTREQPIS